MAVRKLNSEKPEIAAKITVSGTLVSIIATIICATWYLSSELHERPTLDQMNERVSITLDSKLKDFQSSLKDVEIKNLKEINSIDQNITKIQDKINELANKIKVPPLEIIALEDSIKVLRNNIAQLLKMENLADTSRTLFRDLFKEHIGKSPNQAFRCAS